MGNSSADSVRLGRRKPHENEMLTEQQIQELVEEMMKNLQDSPVTLDPFISPALAPDDHLKGLPPIHIFVRVI